MRIADAHDAGSLSPRGARGMLVVIVIIVMMLPIGFATVGASPDVVATAVAPSILTAVMAWVPSLLTRRGSQAGPTQV
ncbi:hypothetical protein ACFRCG_09480 [Embleya sp. NPDC056575]|uniref:hypothetical protein n=1 Tax=unclassified Embleya TaxID=2699296 RepID=UPI0036B77C91